MSFITEQDKRIYETELRPRLPRKIFDAHVHIWGADSFPQGFKFPEKSCSNRFGGTFTLDQWREITHEILPAQEVSLNCFGSPEKNTNRGISPEPDNETVFSMALLSPRTLSTRSGNASRTAFDRLQAVFELRGRLL